MYLAQIKLTNFRNYEFESFDFSPNLNLVAGLNGMGKTNLLDAIYYLCMGKSHFSGSDRNVVRQGSDFFRLEAKFSFKNKTENLVAKVKIGKLKIFELNGSPYPRLSDHVGLLPVVFKVPDDTALVMEGSEERRRFMDNTLCQLDPNYLSHLIAYNKLLQKRNALLKQFVDQRVFDQSLLETYNHQMTRPSDYVFKKRTEFISDFEPVFNAYYKIICEGKEKVGCHFRSQLFENGLDHLMDESIEKDRILQRTTVGIHKDDLQFKMNGRTLKRFASQGQLKSFVLSLKLAQYDYLKDKKGIKPILLLDDLFDKLDDKRVGLLLELLVNGDFGQIFITDTQLNRSEELVKHFESNYEKYIIANGKAT